MKNSNQVFAPPPNTYRGGIFLTTLVVLLFTFVLTPACQRDTAEATEDKTVATSKAESRTQCGLLGYCDFTIMAINASTVELCGDFTSSSSGCNFVCNTLNDDRTDSVILSPTDEVVFCVNMDGSICLRNPSTATTDAVLRVYFEGTSTPVNVTIPPGEVRCFHTNSSCATINGCN